MPISIAYAKVDMTIVGNTLSPIVNMVVYPIIELLFGIAIVLFVYGMIQMIIHGTDPDGRDKGKKTMSYGIIGLFIMVSSWGIIYVISNTVKQIFGQ